MKEWDVEAACGTYIHIPLCVHARACVYIYISCRMEGNEDYAILAVVPPYPILAFLAGCSHRKPLAFFLLVQHMYACPPYGEPDGMSHLQRAEQILSDVWYHVFTAIFIVLKVTDSD